MKRVGFSVLLCTWLYGVPFLLVVGLVRRTSSPYLPTRSAAEGFGTTTDTILSTALLLNLALPVVGALLAGLVGDQEWTRRFLWSLVGMALIYFAVSIAGSAATAPLIGHTPSDEEPTPRTTQCIPISGGRGCPGG
ncbi:hypothetical protein Vqi01_56520 [Micromonospora qiuiae]|uniref:Major facilitator superfamily (MFS) profile domain-containing protein n=1 Tax=Micromonospora qiuiae TaxID=502268 RepID=A0ABQ4JIR6_9ACTN|nr:hypothetical protein [Micromonospora qiuiae]GIJ30490.1 hypothetical protein Vqi01_56520 [Micromonospora qiuiae]